MTDNWNDPKFAEDYMSSASDASLNWYEHVVNAPSLWGMLPHGAKRVLDFGCGPGEFTAQLKEKGYDVEGCDGSQAMVKLAQDHYSGMHYFVWDGAVPITAEKLYDAIISKLALHFVDDLERLALNFQPLLVAGGSVLISVPHPVSTIPKINGAYFMQQNYDTEIGSYGMLATMIHRSIEGYTRPFLRNGYVLADIGEPSVSSEIIEKYHVRPEWAAIPHRLNVRFALA